MATTSASATSSTSSRRPRLSQYARQRIQRLMLAGATVAETVKALECEGIATCRQTVWRIQRRIEQHGTTKPLPKSGRPTKLTPSVLQSIENAMQRDDETTGKELVACVRTNNCISLSATTALKGRGMLGWTRRGTAYCQLIREANRVKRLQWARDNLGQTFDDVIWSDETSVQMESHRRFHCYKKGYTNLGTSHVPNTLSKSMSGLALVRKVQLVYAFLKE